MAGNHLLKRLLITLIRCYRYTLSAFVGMHCRFQPTCSCYSITAIEQYGCLKGVYLTFRRLLRCHPWHPGGYDPVP